MEEKTYSSLKGKTEWLEDILSFSETGLWSIVIDNWTGVNKMSASRTMLDLLGLEEHPSEEACYNHWWENVEEDYREYVKEGVAKMCATNELVEVQYSWCHPKLGRIVVRCAGKVESRIDNSIEIRGYHQNVTELEMLKEEKFLSAEEIKKITREEKKYNSLVQSIICGISQYYLAEDGSMRFKQANQEAMRILGYTEEEFWKKEYWKTEEILQPQKGWAGVGKQRKLFVVGDKITYEYCVKQKNGKDCWIIGNSELIKDIDDDIVVQSVFMDVTSQKELELQNQRLNEETQLWRQSLRDSLKNTDIFELYYYPQEGVLTIPSEVAEKYKCKTCYTDLIGDFAAQLADPLTKQTILEIYQKIHNGERTADGEFALAGGKVWLHATMSVLSYDEQGKPTLVIGIVEDISNRKMIELENIQLQYIYNFTINHEYDCICILDLKDKRYSLRYSRTGQQITIPTSGIITEDVITGLKEMFGGDVDKFLLKNIMDVFTEDMDSYSVYYKSKGDRHKEARYCWFDAEKQTLIVTVRDIEEMWQQEEQSKSKLRDALKEAERANEAKSDFLSRMSHDIRTPLNAVIGMVDIAKKNCGDAAKVDECLRQISSSSHYLYLLINDILDMSKIENGKLELYEDQFILGEFVENICTIIGPLAADRQHSLIVNDKGIVHHKVEGDALRLQQLLINIVSNAVKYTNPGGRIEFTFEEMESQKENYGCYQFVVKDNGIGMDKEFLPSIFTPFERKDSKRVGKIEGTGLGMAIAKNIANMMDGDIAVESELNVGSTFTITVFLKLLEEVSEETTQTSNELPDFSDRRVLLVEDNAINREVAKEMISVTGAQIDMAENGEDGVKRMKEVEEGYYSMIFMDIRMPVMDGYEAAEAIRALDREDVKKIPIIAMTADAFAEDIKRAKKSGMNDHIAKPIDLLKLYDTMRRWKQ